MWYITDKLCDNGHMSWLKPNQNVGVYCVGHIVVHVPGPALHEVDLKAVCLPAHVSQHQGQQAGLMLEICKGLQPNDICMSKKFWPNLWSNLL